MPRRRPSSSPPGPDRVRRVGTTGPPARAGRHDPDDHHLARRGLSALAAAGPTAATAAEARRLREAVEEGRRAEQRLVTAHLGLVRWATSRIRLPGISDDDLLQAGTVGLLDAIRSYDPDRGTAFSTWALPAIRHAVGDFLARNQHPVRVPRVRHQRLLAARRARDHTRAGSRETWPATLTPTIPLDHPTPDRGDGGRSRSPAERLAAPDRPDQVAEAAELARQLQLLLADLPDRRRRIVTERFGLDGRRPLGTVEQALDHGLSRESIRLNYNAALATLRRLATERQLDAWLQPD